MRSRKPFKSPYRSASDFRLKVFRFVFTQLCLWYLIILPYHCYYSGSRKSSSPILKVERKVSRRERGSQMKKRRKCSSVTRPFLVWKWQVSQRILCWYGHRRKEEQIFRGLKMYGSEMILLLRFIVENIGECTTKNNLEKNYHDIIACVLSLS